MSRTPARFVRLLLAVGIVGCIYLVAVDAPPVAIVTVVLVVAVAVVQQLRLVAAVRNETVRAIEMEDPAGPDGMGDITEALRKRIELERLGAERLAADLRLSIEAAAMAVLIIETDGRIVASAGATADLVAPGPVQRVKNPQALELVDEVESTRRVVSDTIVMGLSGRSYQWVVSPLDSGDVGAVVTDVTELDRVQAMRRSFVTDASHELKTPIASIRAGAGALEMAIGKDDEKARHFARRMEEQAERLGRIVTDLLDLSRLESIPPELEPLALGVVVGSELDAVRMEAAEAGVGLSGDVDEVSILGVEADVGLAVGNLLRNAIRYTPSGGRVRLRCFDRDGRAVVEVEDTGVGIPTSDQELVFHRFHRVDAARSRDTGGTGLGLAIVRHIAGAHGGSVSVRSVVGQGSTFILDLGPVSTA